MMVSNASASLHSVLPVMEVTVNLSDNSTSSNMTYSEVGDGATLQQKDPMVTLTVPAMMFASGVFGNVLAIFVLWRSSNDHKQTVFYRLVGALAVTDLFGTCATSPITLAVYANKLKWVGGDALCEYEGFMLIFAGFSTMFIVGSMAVDRYLAITYPFFYNQHISYGKAKYLIAAVWLTAAIISSLPLIGLGDNIQQFPGTWCFFTFTSREIKNQIFAYFYASLGLFVVGVTAVSNVFVTLILLKMRRKAIRSMNLSNTRRHESELQMMILLLGIIVVFSTCWSPFLIRIIINQINFKQIDVRADLHALRLASLNQILDPWIYILFRKELFMRTFKFLKESISVICGCICLRRILIRRSNNILQNSSPCNKAMEVCENGQMISRRAVDDKEISSNGLTTRKLTNSSSTEDSEETLPLRPQKSCAQETLCLKHSACLFCLSNHPKQLALLSMSDSKSAEAITAEQHGSSESLKLTADQGGKSGEDTRSCENLKFSKSFELIIPHNDNNTKRTSLHLSLENLKKDGGCVCLHYNEEQATRR